MKTHKLLFSLLLSLLVVVSCGGGDDDDDNAQREEAPTADNDTNDDNDNNRNPGPACLTNTERQRVRAFLTELSNSGSFAGTATTTTTAPGEPAFSSESIVTYDFIQVSDNEWSMVQTCTSGCLSLTFPIVLTNRCMTFRGDQTNVQSASSGRIVFTTKDDLGSTSETYTLNDGSFRFRSVQNLSNGRTTITSFKED